MNETIYHIRSIENKDWATILFVVALSLIAISKSTYGNKFNDFIRLLVSDKYNQVYRDTSNLKTSFTITMFFINMISLSFFIQIALFYFNYLDNMYNWIVFIQIFTFLMFFVLSKFLIEKIIATTFGIEEYVDYFNLQKVNYRVYIGFLLLPIDIVLFYSKFATKTHIIWIIFIILVLNIINYTIFINKNRNSLFRKLFYFILYLCALEIAPYYFLCYWFTKSNI